MFLHHQYTDLPFYFFFNLPSHCDTSQILHLETQWKTIWVILQCHIAPWFANNKCWNLIYSTETVLQKVVLKRAHVLVWELIEESSNEMTQPGVKSEFDP